MKRITINVTEDNIKRGVPGSYNSCPIALALGDMGYKNYEVCSSEISLSGDYGYAIPSKKIKKFIQNFDTDVPKFTKNIVPQKFVIDLLTLEEYEAILFPNKVYSNDFI